MDIESLKSFIAVAQLGSFSAAADKLCITQPAISKRIASLETQLDTRLFDRINRTVVLTEAGNVLLPKAIGILISIDDARKSINKISGEIKGELRVATSHHIGLHKLPTTLRQFAAKYPEVNLKFEFLDSEVAFSRVAKGLCELAVVTLGDTDYQDLQVTSLWQDPLSFVTSPTEMGPLSTTLKQLSQRPAILPDLNTFTGRIVKQCFDEHHLLLGVNMYTNYLETIKMLVSVGLGWSVLPRSMVDEQLKEYVVDGVHLSRQLGIIQHPQRTLTNAANAFCELLQT